MIFREDFLLNALVVSAKCVKKKKKTNLLEMYASAIDLTGCDILTEYFFCRLCNFFAILASNSVRMSTIFFVFSSMKKVFSDKFYIVSADADRSKH